MQKRDQESKSNSAEGKGSVDDCHLSAPTNSEGEMERAEMMDLRAQVEECLSAGATWVWLDFSEVGFMDEEAVAALVRCHADVGEDAHLVIAAMSPFVRQKLQRLGVLSFFLAPA